MSSKKYCPMCDELLYYDYLYNVYYCADCDYEIDADEGDE